MPGSTPFKTPIVTLSWDDGHPLDMRIARLMLDSGLAATFYISTDIRPKLDDHQLIELVAMGMEIGSHGSTHAPLTSVSNIDRELTESKHRLEQTIGKAVSCFCYPYGRYSQRAVRSVRGAGYDLARTTVGFMTDRCFDRFHMPVTLQFAPQSHYIHLRHATRQLNVRGMFVWGMRLHFETDLLRLAKYLFNEARRRNGIFHLWGHSWEIDELGLWDALGELCCYISGRSDVTYATNASCLA